MVTKERINTYKKWFENMSFFSFNSFILDEIENLWNLSNYIYDKYIDVIKDINFQPHNFSYVSLEENISLAQQFLDKNNINVSIKELIANGNIIFKKIDDKTAKSKDGTSYYDKDNKRVIEIYLNNNVIDSCILIHEIMHFLNQPESKRDFVSDLLTESLSYGMEFIYIEELKQIKYSNDLNIFMKFVVPTILKCMDKVYYCYKLILLYKKEKDISLETYNKVFKDNNYEKTIDRFEEYVKEHNLVVRDTWNVLGFPIAIYILETYKKDNDFIKILMEYNKAINEKSYQECLDIIGLNIDTEFIDKIKSSTNSFLESLSSQKIKKL